MAIKRGRKRSLEAARAKMSITVPAGTRAAIARAGETYELADGTVTAMAVERGLPAVLESLRKRAGREGGREGGQDTAK